MSTTPSNPAPSAPTPPTTTSSQDLEDLVAFLLETSDPKRAARARCFHFVLVHEKVDGSRDVLSQDWLTNSQAELEQLLEGARNDGADRIARSFIRAATKKTSMLPRKQWFEVCAYTTDKADKTPITSHGFPVDPPGQKKAVVVEDPSAAGVTAQLQRTVETLGERLEGLVGKLVDHDSRKDNMFMTFGAKHAELNVTLMGKLIDATTAAQTALNQENTRKVETDKAQLDLEDRRMLRQFLIGVANKWTDEKIGKHGSIVALVRRLAKDPQKIRFFHDHVLETDEERHLLREGLTAHLGINVNGQQAQAQTQTTPATSSTANGAGA